MAMKPIPAASVIVTDGAGSILLVQRGREPGRGLWAFPGGRIKPGETPAQAASRELFEETGIAIAPDTLCLIGHRLTAGTPVFEIAVHVGTSTARPVAGDDAADARFVTADKLQALPLVEGVADLALAALSGRLANH